MAALSHPEFRTGPPPQNPDILEPLRHWFNQITPHSPKQAHLICYLIPPTCPFARTIKLFGYTLFRIPPLRKLNPLYEEFIALRFRALTYLADK